MPIEEGTIDEDDNGLRCEEPKCPEEFTIAFTGPSVPCMYTATCPTP